MTNDAKIEFNKKKFPFVSVYKEEFNLLLNTLLENAVKFQKKGEETKIKIDVEQSEGEYQFSISDNGIGIDPQFHERIFHIFQRLHPQSIFEGNGIGLSQAQKVVDLHGGKIWVESEEGKGSKFIFTIPKDPNNE